MGSTPAPPQPQDPFQVAQAQQQQFSLPSAVQSQAGTMVSQFNPFGSLQYQQTGTGPGGIPLYSSSIGLAPQEQALFNIFGATRGAAGVGGQNLIQGANYGAVDPTTAIGTETSGIQGTLMNQWLSSQQPWLNNQTQQLDTQLRNQGLNPSPTATNDPSTWGAYERAMGQLRQSQGMTVAGAASQFQPTAFGEASQLYQLPAQLGTALSQFGQPISPTGSLVQTPGLQVQPANLESDVAQAEQMQMQAYQAQLAAQSSMMSGLFGAGGNILGGMARVGAFGISDRKLKKNIKKIGKLPSGLNLYSFEYKHSDIPRIGVMADEVEKVLPEAVNEYNGYKYVNYDLIG
jgi:hypothetical protein